MYLYSFTLFVLFWTVSICHCRDYYQNFNEKTFASATENLPFSPGKCHFRIGNGKLFSSRFFRRFNYPTPAFSCLYLHCTKYGEVKLLREASGCHFNNTCLRFGESFTDNQCRTWTCSIDYRAWLNSKDIKMGIYIDRMKTKCMLNGRCRERGEIVFDKTDCITKRCTVYGRPLRKWILGEIQYWKPLATGCKVGDVCYKQKTLYITGCATYRCDNKIITKERLLFDGRFVQEHSIAGGMTFVKTGCKKFNNPGCLEVGDHTNFGQCITYTCMENGSNVLTSEGCPNALTKQCGKLGDVIAPLPCVSLQCGKVGNVYSYKYMNEGCFNGLNCTNIGEIGYEQKSDCLKTCKKSAANGMIVYKYDEDCIPAVQQHSIEESVPTV